MNRNYLSDLKGKLSQRCKSSRGAVFIEIAIGAPFFLAIIFACLWLGYALLTVITIRSSVINAVVAASTRGNSGLVGSDLIPELNNYNGDFSSVENLLTDGSGLTGAAAKAFYDNEVIGSYPNASGLEDLPKEALYALYFALIGMEKNLGSGIVRYPCDPAGSGPFDGPGCLACRFMSLNELAADLNETLFNNITHQIPFDRIGLRCSYQMYGRFMSQVMGLLSGGSGAVAPTVFVHSHWKYLDGATRLRDGL